MPPIVATGRGTDIYQALNDALADVNRLSAVVLISDGQHNGSNDPLEIAEKARSLGIPIFAVAVGDPSRPTNLSVTAVRAPKIARADEPFEIEARVYAQDVSQPSVHVELVQAEEKNGAAVADSQTVVDNQEVAIPAGGGGVLVHFQTTVSQPGNYRYQVRVPIIDGESKTEDNRRDADKVVDVVDQKVRVLLISGMPNWDYQLVQRLLQRDANISLTCWLQSVEEGGTQQGNERISTLPRTIKDGLGYYNVIILMDPNPDEFDKEWIENLKLFCKRLAGGVLFVAGPKYTGDFISLNELRGIRDLLPVRFRDDDFIESTQLLNEMANRPGQMLVRDQFLDHPIMAFVPDPAENKKIWNEMPDIYWSFPDACRQAGDANADRAWGRRQRRRQSAAAGDRPLRSRHRGVHGLQFDLSLAPDRRPGAVLRSLLDSIGPVSNRNAIALGKPAGHG